MRAKRGFPLKFFFQIQRSSAGWTLPIVPNETVVPWGVPGANARAGLVN